MKRSWLAWSHVSLLKTNTTMRVAGCAGKHFIFHGDSTLAEYRPTFDLVLTGPPYFHPNKADPKHGYAPIIGDLDCYAEYVSNILGKAFRGLKEGKLLCFVKTDIWYKGRLIPIGYRIADSCSRRGLTLRFHWIWQRFCYYSPYSPSFANIFIFGKAGRLCLSHCGIVSCAPLTRYKGYPPSFTPGIFEALIGLLSGPGDIILDPFVGVGGVVEAAARVGRWSVGIEKSKSQLTLARKRLADIPGVVFGSLNPDRNGKVGLKGDR